MDFISLFGEFPVLVSREFTGNPFEFPSQRRGRNRDPWPPGPKFPGIFPPNRERQGGDRFADDCLHRQLSSTGRTRWRCYSIADPLSCSPRGLKAALQSREICSAWPPI